jgi:hypothetical protein
VWRLVGRVGGCGERLSHPDLYFHQGPIGHFQQILKPFWRFATNRPPERRRKRARSARGGMSAGAAEVAARLGRARIVTAIVLAALAAIASRTKRDLEHRTV